MAVLVVMAGPCAAGEAVTISGLELRAGCSIERRRGAEIEWLWTSCRGVRFRLSGPESLSENATVTSTRGALGLLRLFSGTGSCFLSPGPRYVEAEPELLRSILSQGADDGRNTSYPRVASHAVADFLVTRAMVDVETGALVERTERVTKGADVWLVSTRTLAKPGSVPDPCRSSGGGYQAARSGACAWDCALPQPASVWGIAGRRARWS